MAPVALTARSRAPSDVIVALASRQLHAVDPRPRAVVLHFPMWRDYPFYPKRP